MNISMRQRLRTAGWVLVSGTLVVVAASPSAAEVVEGSCDGAVTIQDTDTTIEASAPADTTIVVPATATVDYSATLGVDAPADPETAEGDVVITLPIGEWEVASWSDETTLVAVEGTHTYRAPAWVPRGSGAIPLEVTHVQGDTVCRADFRVSVDGSPWSAQSALLLLLTLLGAIGTFAAGRDQGAGTGRPVLGAVSGFFFGLMGAASLFAFGFTALDSPLFWILPIVGMLLGVGLGAWGPLEPAPAAAQPADTGAEADTAVADPDVTAPPGESSQPGADSGQPPTEPR